jgi:hypothetical protein
MYDPSSIGLLTLGVSNLLVVILSFDSCEKGQIALKRIIGVINTKYEAQY